MLNGCSPLCKPTAGYLKLHVTLPQYYRAAAFVSDIYFKKIFSLMYHSCFNTVDKMLNKPFWRREWFWYSRCFGRMLPFLLCLLVHYFFHEMLVWEIIFTAVNIWRGLKKLINIVLRLEEYPFLVQLWLTFLIDFKCWLLYFIGIFISSVSFCNLLFFCNIP